MTTTPPKSAPLFCLLRLDRRDVAGLAWVRERSRFWLHVLRRRRKYAVARGVGFEPEEADVLRALIDLERAASRLIDFGEPGRNR